MSSKIKLNLQKPQETIELLESERIKSSNSFGVWKKEGKVYKIFKKEQREAENWTPEEYEKANNMEADNGIPVVKQTLRRGTMEGGNNNKTSEWIVVLESKYLPEKEGWKEYRLSKNKAGAIAELKKICEPDHKRKILRVMSEAYEAKISDPQFFVNVSKGQVLFYDIHVQTGAGKSSDLHNVIEELRETYNLGEG